MANEAKTIGFLALVGAGGYLYYEYQQYSKGINAVAASSGQPAAALEGLLSILD